VNPHTLLVNDVANCPVESSTAITGADTSVRCHLSDRHLEAKDLTHRSVGETRYGERSDTSPRLHIQPTTGRDKAKQPADHRVQGETIRRLHAEAAKGGEEQPQPPEKVVLA
jgi:hypothetical protein